MSGSRTALRASPLSPSRQRGKGGNGITAFLAEEVGSGNPSFMGEPAPHAAAMAVLYSCCGLTDPGTMEFFLVLTRMPCAIAEGKAVSPGGFRDYPIDLPVFTYRDEE